MDFSTVRAYAKELAKLGLETEGTWEPYFCTPKGAHILGGPGIDGIHFCQVDGFGKTVFSVNPMGLPREYVHPVAGSLEDFMRLLVTCGVDAVEQAYRWSKEQFERFVSENASDEERQAASKRLQEELHLAPIEDPYGYIRGLQDALDISKLEAVDADSLETEERMRTVPGGVYFGCGFSGWPQSGEDPGKKIPTDRSFSWAERNWRVPAVYLCDGGIVVDLCFSVARGALDAYLGESAQEESEDIRSNSQQEREEAKNPFAMDIRVHLAQGGTDLREDSGAGCIFVPPDALPHEDGESAGPADEDAAAFVEEYGLNPHLGWSCMRWSFAWQEGQEKGVKSGLVLRLEQDPAPAFGKTFAAPRAGDRLPFVYLPTGKEHTLVVTGYETQKQDWSAFPMGEAIEYPPFFDLMTFVLEPELPGDLVTVRDTEESDPPRISWHEEKTESKKAVAIGIIGGADGPTTLFVTGNVPGAKHVAASSLRFDAHRPVTWRMIFWAPQEEPICVDLL